MLTYPEPRRIRHQNILMNTKKQYLGDSEVKQLLSTKVCVEEKIDGSQCGIAFKGGKPIVYTKNRHLFDSDHDIPFKGLWPWVWENYEKVSKIPKGYRICGEWMKVQHHVSYDKLPDWFVAFDILNERTGTLLSYKEKKLMFENLKLSSIPVLGHGMFSKEEVYGMTKGLSSFSTTDNKEGVVVKSDKVNLIGKIVSQEFLDEIEDVGHWTSAATVKFNRRIQDE